MLVNSNDICLKEIQRYKFLVKINLILKISIGYLNSLC